jgi:hypothetical protein
MFGLDGLETLFVLSAFLFSSSWPSISRSENGILTQPCAMGQLCTR